MYLPCISQTGEQADADPSLISPDEIVTSLAEVPAKMEGMMRS